MTRHVPARNHRRPSRIRARAGFLKKGDAEIPSDVELIRLEIEARFKARIDGDRQRALHAWIVARVRHQLVAEQRVRDIGQPSIEDVSNAAADVDVSYQQQSTASQTQDDLLSHICLHVAAEEDELEAIFLSDHSAGETTSTPIPQTPSSLDTTTDNDSYDPIGFTERDYLNISNFEELLNAFPLFPAT
ncbi:hypothetical protein BJ741DRAFT_612769 [Chytriomyces cf. hyalinus JEL632]|nr:hypothetical protein BJ741DRAFT_628443 [Chytriomyces cf. hyalinus JEL632]KAI8833068.1 hypothetical protein BJ741DRAFT_612769 [Chytriomyces cf. hyalinus JEL632]